MPITLDKSGLHVDEIDYLRGLAIIAVLAIHTSAWYGEISKINILAILNIIIDNYSHYAVPLFIMISGFVLSIKYRGRFSVRKFYKKRFLSVVPQYLFFTVFYILLFAAFYRQLPTIGQIIIDFLTGNAGGHLWFLVYIIQLYLLYPLIIGAYEWLRARGRTWIFLAGALVLQTSWSIAFLVLGSLVQLPQIFMLGSIPFLSYLFYFALGIYAFDKRSQIMEWVSSLNVKKLFGINTLLIFTVTLITVYSMWAYGGWNITPIYFDILSIFILLIANIIIIIICQRLATFLTYKNWVLAQGLRNLGKYSFGIYLVHMFYLYGTEVLLRSFGITYNDSIFYPIVFIMVLVLSYISVRILAFIPLSEYVIGKHDTFEGRNGSRFKSSQLRES